MHPRNTSKGARARALVSAIATINFPALGLTALTPRYPRALSSFANKTARRRS